MMTEEQRTRHHQEIAAGAESTMALLIASAPDAQDHEETGTSLVRFLLGVSATLLCRTMIAAINTAPPARVTSNAEAMSAVLDDIRDQMFAAAHDARAEMSLTQMLEELSHVFRAARQSAAAPLGH